MPQTTFARPSARDAGFSLIEVLVTVALMSIVGAAVSAMMVSMQRENRTMTDKAHALQVERDLVNLMLDGPLCACQFAGAGPLVAESPATNPPTYRVDLNRITLACNDPNKTFAVTGEQMINVSPSFLVRRIGAANLRPMGVPAGATYQRYLGAITIEFDPAASNGGARPLNPVRANAMFTVVGNQITTCAAATGSYEAATFSAASTSPVSSFAACPDGYRVVNGGWVTDGLPTCVGAVINASHAQTQSGQQGWLVSATCLSVKAKVNCERNR